MKKYNCESCDFHTNHKPNFERHLKTKKHIESPQSHHLVTTKSPFSHHKVTIFNDSESTPFECHYCFKQFKFKQGMYRHIKYYCKKNKDEDLKELARLLNEKNKQLIEKEQQIATAESRLQKQELRLQKHIDKLTQKLQIQNVVQGNITNTLNQQNNTTNTYNITLLNHIETDYSHLTTKDYVDSIKTCNYCVKNIIQRVHFHHKKPENMNIYISNIKGNYVMIYKDNKWQITNKKDQIDQLYDCNEVLLENWYDENKDQHPEIIKAFERYLKNREEDKVINCVKEKILFMLYNNRNMISDVV